VKLPEKEKKMKSEKTMNTKRILAFTIVIAFALCLVALPGANAATTTTVTVEVKNSQETGIDGVPVRYYDGSWHTFGTTGTDGAGTGKCSLSLTVGNYAFDVSYAYATQQKWQVVSGPTDTVSFQTTEVTMKVLAHDGTTVLTGTNAQYYTGTWYTFGSGTTTTSIELLPGHYAFKVSLAGTTQQKWQDVSGITTDVVFQTTLVTIELKDHSGGTLTGSNPQYYPDTWLNFDSGTTTTSKELLPGHYAFRVTYKGMTQQKWQDVSGITTDVVFQTTLVTMKILASDGTTELPGTNAQYYPGTWLMFDGGSTTSSMELLPANYAFGVTYNGKWEQKWQIIGSGPMEDVIFHTTKVTLQFSGTINYHTGVWNTFTKPSMELFQGTYPFQFDGYQTNIVVAASNIEESIVVVKFLKSGGAGIAGGAAQYYDGSWHAMGTTNGNGILIYEIPGLKGNLAFSMSYAGATTQKWQNIKDDSIVIFHTAPVTMKLLEHDGTTVLTGTGAQYYTGVWNTFGTGTTTTSMELLPGNYCFKVTYAGASQQKWQTIALDPVNVVFQTTMVTMKLNDHSGNKLTPGGTNTQYYTGVWNNFGSGTTETSMELLPGNYAFRLSYNGASQQKWQVIGVGPMEDVVFQTTMVTMELKDHLGVALTGTSPKYYTGTWNTFGIGNTPTSMELLPGNYAFMVSYVGTTNQKWQVIGVGPSETVTFQTTQVTMTLLAHDGTTLSGSSPKYYTGTWNNFGALGYTTDSMELLPGNYAFMVSYNGASQQKWQNVGTNPNVVFQTTEVSMRVEKTDHTELAGTDAKYYTGVWNTFGTGNTIGSTMELLPGNYAFKVSYAGTTNQKWQVIGAEPHEKVVFQTTLVTMKVIASDGSTELTGSDAKYYTGTWNIFDSGITTSSMELLPGNYAFKVSYSGATQQKWQNVGADPVVIFQTTKVTLQFSGTIKYYTGVWNMYSKPSMDLLPGSYAFSFDGYQFWITVGTTNLEKSVLVIKLLDHNGKGLAGGIATPATGGSWRSNLVPTDSKGMTVALVDYIGVTKVRMTYNQGSVDDVQSASVDSYYNYQTAQATVQLIDYSGIGLLNGRVDQGGGYWQLQGYTDASGELKLEMFPGSYKFKMTYTSTSQEMTQNVATPVIFQTGRVVSGGYAVKASLGGAWVTYTSPGMELLPGTYNFVFSAGAPGGTSQSVTVTAGTVTNID